MVTTETLVEVICDVCDKSMEPYREPQATLYLDDPGSGDFPTTNLCPHCYGLVMDYINVDMKKAIRDNV